MPKRIIKLKIHDESDFFSSMDPDRNMVSDEVLGYLSRVFLNKHRRLRENYEIRIISESPVNEEHIKDAIKSEVGQQQDDVRYALKLVSLAVLGAAILALWLYLAATTETVGVEILSIMGWVCVWEATSIALLQRPELRRVWLNLERINRAEVVFQIEEEQNNTSD